MKQLCRKVTANFLAVLFASTLASSTAFAYVFGAPAITEIAEDGQSQGRWSLYQLGQVYTSSLKKGGSAGGFC